MATGRLGFGLYGVNGHQVQGLLAGHAEAELVAVASFGDRKLPEGMGDVPRYDTLDELLADDPVDAVSLCSPRRADQAADAVKALRAGKHVYGEKPSALTEAGLNAIMAACKETGKQYHEMGGTGFEPPYNAARECVASGAIGEVVQVFAQKCYPWGDWRPAAEELDGGLALQVGVYAVRFVEFVAGVKVSDLQIRETSLGNEHPNSECRRAVSMIMTLANGGLASAVCNYLNPAKHLGWGYEIVRVFGTDGIVETDAFRKSTRLLKEGQDPLDLDTNSPCPSWFDRVVGACVGREPLPLTLEEELSASRWTIRAKAGTTTKE